VRSGALRVVEPSTEDIQKASRFYLARSTFCVRRRRMQSRLIAWADSGGVTCRPIRALPGRG